MAFFKFRLPGKTAAAASESLAAAPGQSVEVLRRRARHRLFGSVVLVFTAVVAFPLLFDSQPRPVAVDTPIVIPERSTTPPLTTDAPVPVAQAPAKPLLPAASSEVPPHASLDPGKEEVVASPAPTRPASAIAPSAEPVAKPASAPVTVPKSAAPSKAEVKTDAKAEVRNENKDSGREVSDAQKAKALLEGKSAATDGTKLVVQVGAFSDPDKLREVRRKLEQAGLKTHTRSIEGKDGKRSTRVRVGPFDTRAEADKAAARIRKLDLQANVIAL
jgi:DedD protein